MAMNGRGISFITDKSKMLFCEKDKSCIELKFKNKEDRAKFFKKNKSKLGSHNWIMYKAGKDRIVAKPWGKVSPKERVEEDLVHMIFDFKKEGR